MDTNVKAFDDYNIGSGKMNSFDWLSDFDFEQSEFDIVEVKFKGGRKEFYKNKNKIDLSIGDYVVCEMPTGYHLGSVSLKGALVRLQLKRRKVYDTAELKNIYRIASKEDLEKHKMASNRDKPTLIRTREICKDMGVNMKLTDVEYQSDNSKATFYYTADNRVDFRELIKVLAAEFKIRVEMRQISLRQEAARLGGIGSCGREMCCSTWMFDPKPVPNAAVKYQNLSSNPAKLSSHCGRLKCSLNFELETYIDARKGIPVVDTPLKTERGNATLQKTDIFRKLMWFSYPKESNWHSISCAQVELIQEMNKQGKKPINLNKLSEVGAVEEVETKNSEISLDIDKINKKYPKLKKKKSFGRRKKNATTEERKVSPEQQQPTAKRKSNKRRRNQKSKGKNSNQKS